MNSKAQTTPAFPEPNHTQTPNNFFDMIPDMTDAELRVTLVMIRQTFGWHREGFKMGVAKLGHAAGLCRQAVLDGAAAAEQRGTFRRANPGAQGEAEWELIVALQAVDTLQPVEGGEQETLYSVEGGPLPSRGQVALKESIKERIEKNVKLPIDWLIASGKPITQEDLKADPIEEIFVLIEQEFRINVDRSPKNQAVAKRILKDGRPLADWLAWCKRDEWRAAHLYLYRSMERIWGEFPQAFGAPEKAEYMKPKPEGFYA